jgi:hypothetical protein
MKETKKVGMGPRHGLRNVRAAIWQEGATGRLQMSKRPVPKLYIVTKWQYE